MDKTIKMHFNILDKISSGLPLDMLQFFGGSRLVPMVYHTVGNPTDLPYLKGLYNMPTPERFEADIDFILKHYRPLSLDELIKYKRTKTLPGNKNYFYLSFDDGLRQCIDIIAPILKGKGVPATFFINTGFVGNENFLHRFKVVLLSEALKKDETDTLKNRLETFTGMQFTCRYKAAKYCMTLRYPERETIDKIIDCLELDILGQLRGFKPYMDLEDIKSLVGQGFSVGAHSVGHPEFYLLDESQQLNQACKSMQQIDEWFRPKYRVFAFPFTDVGVKVSFFNKLKEHCEVDLTFGCSGLKKDVIDYNVHRIPMDDLELNAERRLKTEFLHYFAKRFLAKNTYRRK